MELEQVVPEARPPSRYLKPGRMPSGNRHNLLEPLEPPAGAEEKVTAQAARWDTGEGEREYVSYGGSCGLLAAEDVDFSRGLYSGFVGMRE